MLHEPASTPTDNPKPLYNEPEAEADPILERHELALTALGDVMRIEKQIFPEWQDIALEDRALMVQGAVDYLLTVEGELIIESELAYTMLDKALSGHDMTALFRERHEKGRLTHVIHVLDGRIQTPEAPSPIPNIVLLILTIASLLFIGTATAIGEIELTNPALADSLRENLVPQFWRGLPYTLSILLILGSHEMAHWLMMRKHHVVSSLPYFIPSFIFSPFGTFGAIIITKGAIRNRKALFDIGVSGPLAGLVFAIPILLIGLATSPVVAISGGVVEGNSLGYALAKVLVFGQFLPDGTHDVMLNQLAWAGWTGLFVTALNLIPLGQLDGGHILYAVFGSSARLLYIPILAIALFLTLFVSNVWMILLLMLVLLGRVYAVPLNDITPIDPLRRAIALFTIIMFGVIFVPSPLATADGSGGLLSGLLVIISWQMLRGLLTRLNRRM